MIKPGHLKDSTEELLQNSLKEASAGEPSFQNKEKNPDKIPNDATYSKARIKISIHQKLVLLSLLILPGLGFMGYAVYKANQKLLNAEERVQHTEQVIYQSGNILSISKDVETASLDFVITKDSSLLGPLYTAEKKASSYISQLKQLTRDNPLQQRRIDLLNFYIHKRLDFSFQMVELRSNQGLAPAIAYTSNAQDKQYTEHLQQITTAIQDEENTLLKQQKETNRNSVAALTWFSVIVFILVIALSIVLLSGGAKYLLQQKQANELKQLNAQLEQKVIERTANMDKYKYFFYNTLDLACFASADGYFEELNESFAKILGYTKDDLLDKKFLEFIHPDDIEATLKVMGQLSAGAVAVNFTNRYKTKSNTYKHLEWSSIFNTVTKRICAIARDVTDKITGNRETGIENKEKEKRAEELTIANKELGFQNEEKEKQAAELTIANKALAFQNEEKEKRAAELIIANKELVFQHEEKEKRAAELVIANKELVFQNEEKEKRAAEMVIANNELKKAEDDIRKLNEELEQKVIQRTIELESANKELESFSYSVSHDLRAPLRAVHGYARILNEDFGSQFNPEASRVMGNIINNSKKMGQLIDDLLTFSRLGRKELVKMNIPMQEMATNLCNEMKNDQDNRIIQFKIDELQPVRGDIAAIKQVWINLISNAVKYSKLNENAVIDITSETKGNEIIFSIKDNGAGFDMRYANKLFGVFQRLHSDEKFEGTGVGLAIVHRIISKHGGKVWAEGKVNHGATFYFSLPKNESPKIEPGATKQILPMESGTL